MSSSGLLATDWHEAKHLFHNLKLKLYLQCLEYYVAVDLE